jgi:4'-phosphopantetheinyl transferase
MLEAEDFRSLICDLPPSMQDRARTYKKWQDQQRYVVGKKLLLTGLQSFENADYTINNLQYTAFQRPYIRGTIDFNISHAGDFTVCALSESSRVGIDIEKIGNVILGDFGGQLSEHDFNEVLQAENRQSAFYRLWTQKEASLKAVGIGLNIPLKEVAIENRKAVLNGQEWFLHEIDLHEEYICHLCTSVASPIIVTREIKFTTGNCAAVGSCNV